MESYRKGIKPTKNKPLVDLTGRKFGRLLVIKQSERKNNRIAWLCKCDCGKEVIVIGKTLTNGLTTSCGCYRKEIMREKSTKHLLCDSRIYDTYNNMKKRCFCKNCDHYKWYGEENKSICDEWLGEHGFENFAKWSMENGYTEKLTIDRIDNTKGYSPDNCRWVTMKENCRNKRNNHLITIGNDTKTLVEWCEIYGIPDSIVRARIRIGWNEIKALTTPKMRTGGKRSGN